MKHLTFIFLVIIFLASNGFAQRFADMGDGTVIDTNTDLMWTKNAGLALGSWEDMMDYCSSFELAEYDDWYLPSIDQLNAFAGVYPNGGLSGHLGDPDSPFISVANHSYWSSTVFDVDESYYYAMHVNGLAEPTHIWVNSNAWPIRGPVPDTDDDGSYDPYDNCPENNNPDQTDLDGDELGDVCDTCPNDSENDIDGDGYCSDIDNCPNNHNPSQKDSDNNGKGDACDLDGFQAALEARIAILEQAMVNCGCPYTPVDSDGDEYCIGITDGCTYADLDCDDTNAAINPGATEICDGADNNCDGQIDEGFGTTTCGLGVCDHTISNCVDGITQECNPLEGAGPEICDGLDNDCDGLVDEELGQTTCGLGVCVHTIENCVGGIPQTCEPLEGAIEEVCDNLDNDCDGITDDGLGQTTCGLGVCEHAVDNCIGGVEQTCDPFEGAGSEVCDNLDNNCDGVVDEGLGQTTCGLGVCIHTVDNCIGGVPQTCNPFAGATSEVCDGLDNDCDGTEDDGVLIEYYIDNDGDGYGVEDVTQYACSLPVGYADNNLDCEDADDAINPGATEVCDEVDNNCDDSVDEGVTTTYYLDGDGDGYGTGATPQEACALPVGYTDNDMDCDDSNADIYPNAPEICDEVDNQCPDDEGYGQTDENGVCVSDDLIAWWKFDDVDGTIATDTTENGNDGTLENGPTWTTTGQINGALDFDGEDDYVDVGALDIFGDEMTISVWARADSFFGSWRDNRLISKATGTATNDHWWMVTTIYSGGATRLRFRLKAQGNEQTDTLIASSGDITIGEWFHAVVTYDGTDMKIYKNGQLVGSVEKSGGGGSISTDPGVDVFIGCNPDGYGEWDGRIDDLRIYDIALTAQEVQDLYNEGL